MVFALFVHVIRKEKCILYITDYFFICDSLHVYGRVKLDVSMSPNFPYFTEDVFEANIECSHQYLSFVSPGRFCIDFVCNSFAQFILHINPFDFR